MEGMACLGELGEPVTLTSIAAAAGVVEGIVAALKQIGDIFLTKKKESADFDESKTDAPENNVTAQTNSTSSSSQTQEAIVNPSAQNNNQTPSTITDADKSSDSTSENFDSSSEQNTPSSNNAIVKTSNYSTQ